MPRGNSTQTQRASAATETSAGFSNTVNTLSPLSPTDRAVESWRANQEIGPSNTGDTFNVAVSQSAGTTSTFKPDMRPNRILGIRKWIGTILAIEDGLLTAEMFPFDHDGPALVTDFELRLLAPDQALAAPGGIVYLTTRTISDDWGQETATTQLRLRRPWRWTQEELGEILSGARKKAHILLGYARRRTR